MDQHIYVRVNGRGNAWPVFLGSDHPFYNNRSSDDLSNASFSIINSCSTDITRDNVKWEVVVDAGHHTVPFLIKNLNRLPEAIVLTHPHMDHSLGLDWIAQSYSRLNNNQRFPVYATKPCFDFVIQSYPHLKNIIDYHELKPGVTTMINRAEGLQLTQFPVFHGESGYGASMLLFEVAVGQGKYSRILFTGDMLSPLLRKADYKKIANSDIVFCDCNNRFPYPGCNHESFSITDPSTNKISRRLVSWRERMKISHLLAPHLVAGYDKDIHAFFDEFINDYTILQDIPCSVMEFVKLASLKNICLIHYSGLEDMKYYSQDILDEKGLGKWANEQMNKLSGFRVNVPKTGELKAI